MFVYLKSMMLLYVDHELTDPLQTMYPMITKAC